jgi:hypothetical protein
VYSVLAIDIGRLRHVEHGAQIQEMLLRRRALAARHTAPFVDKPLWRHHAENAAYFSADHLIFGDSLLRRLGSQMLQDLQDPERRIVCVRG